MAEEFKISLGTELDLNSLSNVQSQIDSIKPKQPIKLEIDDSNVQSKIDSIKRKIQSLSNIKINLDGGGGSAVKQSSSSNSSTSTTKANNDAAQLKKSYRELLSMAKQISNMEIKIGGLKSAGGNTKQISVLEGQLKALQNTYQQLMNSFASSGGLTSSVFDAGDMAKLQAAVDSSKLKLAELDAKVADTKAQLAQGIKLDINNGSLSNEIANIEQRFNSLNMTNQTVTNSLTQLKTLLSSMDASDDIESVTSDYQTYKQVLIEVTNQINALQREQKEAVAKQKEAVAQTKLDNAKVAFTSEIDVWMKNNTAAAKQFGSQIQEVKAQIQSADGVTLNNLKAQFKEITQQAKLAGDTGLTFADRLKSQFGKLGVYFSATMMIMQTVNAIKSGINTVVELDDALVDLQKTAKATGSELSSFYYEANDIAKEYGATTREIIQSAADWSRLGYTLDESKMMSKYSSMFASISPGMDVDTATTSLVSVMKAYGIEVEDVMDGIMSKINAVGNSAAESNTDIVTGLQNSAAAMAAMGSTLDETIAIFTAAQEITQDSSKVGNALRSISMRIRGYDEETEQLSADLANITGDVIDLTKTASNPDGISLFTDATQTEYKSIYTYLQEISKIYDEIGAKEQQELMEKLFGKNRASVGAAILNNFSAAEKAMDTMANSAGSAEKEMSVITQSLTYKLNALKETGVGVAQNLFTRSDMGHVIDGLTSIMKVVDFVTDKLGLFKTAALGITAALSFKNIGRDKMFSLFLNMPITMCVLPDMVVSI